jgi:hypothetical protein
VSVALLIIAVLFGLLVLALAVPIDVAFRFEDIEAFKGQIKIRWLFGLVRFRFTLPAAAKSKHRKPEPEPQVAEAPKKPKARGRRANVLAALRQAAFRRRAYRFVKDLLRAAHAHEFYLRLRLGLGDPADTGRLWAFVGPLSVLAQNFPNAEVRIEPQFMDAVCEFETHGRFVLIPLQFIALAIAFALSPPSIRAWLTLKASHA